MTGQTRAVRKPLLRAIAMAAGLAGACAAYGADESAPVQKPQVKEGDTRVYQFTNLAISATKPVRVETRVTFVNADAIVTVDRAGNGPENDSQYTAEWNAISLSSGWVYDRPLRLYKFPIQTGETYPYVFESSRRSSPEHYRNEGTVKVVGWEDVVVPAGKFRAIKIEARGSVQRLDARYAANQRWDIWYAPEVKRAVKSIYESGIPGRTPDVKRHFELMEIKVQ